VALGKAGEWLKGRNTSKPTRRKVESRRHLTFDMSIGSTSAGWDRLATTNGNLHWPVTRSGCLRLCSSLHSSDSKRQVFKVADISGVRSWRARDSNRIRTPCRISKLRIQRKILSPTIPRNPHTCHWNCHWNSLALMGGKRTRHHKLPEPCEFESLSIAPCATHRSVGVPGGPVIPDAPCAVSARAHPVTKSPVDWLTSADPQAAESGIG